MYQRFQKGQLGKKKEIKGIQLGKEEVKLSQFADDMILYIENPKESTKKPFELISEFSKVASCKRNIQKSIIFPYTSNENSENEIKKTIPFIITSKGIKYLDIHLTKEMQDLYTENKKTLLKENLNEWQDVHRLKDIILLR